MATQDPEPAPVVTAPVIGSTSELVKVVSEDVRRLVKAEIALAKAEVGQQVGAKALAVGLLVGAAGIAGFALYWLTYAVFAGWDVLVPPWAAALLTVLVLLVIAGVLVAVAVRILKQPMSGPERAIDAGRETQAVVKQALRP